MNLYVHVPFCPKFCPYCNFYKEAGGRGRAEPFIDAVLRHLDQFTHDQLEERPLAPETIFFGGGTPTALSTPQLGRLIGGLRSRLDLASLREWTIEMNPATVSLEKAILLRELGINRVSMGVQAWDAASLAVLGRVHSAEQALRSYHILREAGFENINLDHIFAVPGQTRDLWLDTLRRSIALGPEHISAYCLTYEEDTEFLGRLERGELSRHPDVEAELFDATAAALDEAGYHQYETSNFARPGRECLHNLGYWRGDDYLGLGPSAFSTCGAERWRCVRDTSAYIEAIKAGRDPADFREHLSQETRQAERLAFGLRLAEGIAIDEITIGLDEHLEHLEAEGLALVEQGRLRLTPRGRLLADEIGALFV